MVATEAADAIPWLIAAGVALGVWFVFFGVIAAATMPRLPDPGPETMELGPESPAVAGFLVSRWKVATTSIAATLVDLAARGHLSLEQIGDGQHLVRLRSRGLDAPRDYERQVMQLVHDRAVNGTVPATELSLGYGNTQDKWWKAFERAVVEHARELRLTRRRFTFVQGAVLCATFAVPMALLGAAGEVWGTVQRERGEDFDAGGGLIMAGFAWLVISAVGARVLRGWRETPVGTTAAAHWLGVRNFLGHDEAFRETPPAGVVIWQRLLSYGVALGVAHGTAAALPIGPTRNDEGWSPQRGIWRQVRIEYPKRFRYGESPRRAAAVSVLVLVLVAVGIVLLIVAFGPSAGDALDEVIDGDDETRFLLLIVVAVFAIPAAMLVVQIVRACVVLARAVSDFSATETFEGYVVRVPWHFVKENNGPGRWELMGYVAVDDGRSDEVRALKCMPGEIKEGQTVRVTITPRLRHVVEIVPA